MRTLVAALTLSAVHLFAAGSAHALGLGSGKKIKIEEIVAFGDSSTDTGNVSQT